MHEVLIDSAAMTPPSPKPSSPRPASRCSQATQLPPRSYVDETVADWEAEHLFLGGWVCVGHAQPLARARPLRHPPDRDESFLFVGDDEGTAHGFFNVCRHRGARLVDEPEGTMRRLQCPYHAWCYGFDGSLKSAPHTERDRGLRPRHLGLNRLSHGGGRRPAVRRRLRHAPARSPTTSASSRRTSSATASATCSRAAAITYDVEANWKAIVENYSECLHCPGVHPELNRLSHYMSGDEYEGAGAWCGGSMTLNEGAETMAAERRPRLAGPRSPG